MGPDIEIYILEPRFSLVLGYEETKALYERLKMPTTEDHGNHYVEEIAVRLKRALDKIPALNSP